MSIDELKIDNILELSPTQQGLLFHSLSPDQQGVYVLQTVARLRGPLDVAVMAQACQDVIAAHSAFRVSFHWQEIDKPIQIVHKDITVPLETSSWVDVADSDEALRRYLAADRARGFDISRAPLLRMHLVQRAATEWWLIWTCHHLVLDGWSLSQVLQELLARYEAVQRRIPIATPAPRPFGDYIAWLQQQDLGQAETFWRRTLAGAPVPTPLPMTSAVVGEGETSQRREMRQRVGQLSVAATRRVQTWARQQHLTVSTVVHAVWGVVLSCYSGAPDVVFGTVVSGRPPALTGVDTMVGLFVNTLPLRLVVRPTMTLGAWLRDVQDRLVALRDYEYSPLVEIQKWSEAPRDRALFDTIVAFENYPAARPVDAAPSGAGSIELCGLTIAEESHYPLTLVAGCDECLWLKVHYDARRFDEAAISQLLEQSLRWLEQVDTRGDRPLGEVSLVGDAERRQLLEIWNATAVSTSPLCVHEWVERHALQTPDAVAVCVADAVVTYGVLNQRANQLAHCLRSEGVGVEVPVGLYMERSLAWVIGVLGILKAGGTYVPLDPTYPQERITVLLRTAQVHLVLTDTDRREGVPAGTTVIDLDRQWTAIAQQPRTNPPRGATPANLAYIIYTSGSTGYPKGVLVEHRALSNVAVAQEQILAVASTARVLQFASASFDASIFELVMALAHGAALQLLAQPLVGPSLKEFLQEAAVTVVTLPPLALAQMSADEVTALEMVTVAGEACPAELVTRWAPGRRFFNLYGPTEATIWATAARCTGGATPPAIGRPIANTQAYVLDAVGSLVPVAVAGELYLGGTGLARGYIGQPALTAAAFIPDGLSGARGARLYRTGDVARWRGAGELEFVGRRDAQVKIRGFRVEPGEVETVLGTHAEVRTAVVVAREDEPGQQRLVAYVVPAGGAAPTTTALRQFLQARVPEYMIPAVFVTLAALPVTPHGKVDRQALPAPGSERPLLEEAYLAPRTATEVTLTGIWQDVLGVTQVGVTDNFFELGGDSILAIQVVARAAESGLQLLPRHVFDHQTIAELAPVVGVGPAPVAEQGPVTGRVPLTPIQQWFVAQELVDAEHFNQTLLLEMRRPLEERSVRAAVGALLAQHDALRLRVRRGAAGWEQVVSAPGGEVPFTRIDLSAVPAAAHGAALVAAITAVQGSLQLTDGPLLRGVWIDHGAAGRPQLLLVVHHLAVDLVSWQFLLEDLETAYTQVAQGSPLRLPAKTSSFKHWAERLQAYAGTPALEAERAYWTTALRPPLAVLPEEGRGANTVGLTRMVNAELTAEDTERLLHEVPRAYRTQVLEVLLTALAQTLAAWTGSGRVLVEVESHGREPLFDDVELSRTVGWFTALYPVVLDVEGVDEPGAALKTVKEQLRRVPHHGIGYGLLRYLRSDAPAAAWPTPTVSFSYLGHFDKVVSALRLFELIPDPSGANRSVRQQRTHLLELGAVIVEGRLLITWKYGGERHSAATIGRLAERFVATLRALIAHCLSPHAGGFTPSDFPLTKLDKDEFERHFGTARNIEDVYPLSPMQQEMVVHAVSFPRSTLGFIQNCWTIRGSFDAQVFKRSWQISTNRNAALRTEFSWDGPSEPLQIVRAEVPIQWEEHDWREVSTTEQLRRLETLLESDRKRGFDLSTAPLARFTLVRFKSEAYYFVFSTHHAILDGWSQSNLLREVFGLYDEGVDIAPSDIAPSFRDYVAWLGRQDMVQAEHYWRQALRGAAQVHLSADSHPGAVNDADRQEISNLRLSTVATGNLEGFAKRHQLTLNTVVHGAWAIALADLAHSTDLILGTTISGRPADLPGADSMVGLLMNMVPVRVQLPADVAVVRWLQDLQTHLVEVSQWGFVSRAQLQGWLPEHLQSGPLFESVIVFENYPKVQPSSSKKTFDEFNLVRHVGTRTNHPLTLVALPGTEFSFGLIHSARYFKRRTAQRLLSRFEAVLTGFTASLENQVVAAFLPGERRIARGSASVRRPAKSRHSSQESEIERVVAALQRHPGIRDAVVQHVGDSRTDRQFVAYIVPRESQSVTLGQVREFLKQRLADSLIPTTFVFLNDAARTPDGRIDESRLPSPGQIQTVERAKLAVDPRPRDPLELELAVLWEEILNVRPIGRDDNFFALGGSSIQAIRLLASVHERFGQHLPLSVLLKGGTITDFVHIMRERLSDPHWSSLVAVRRDDTKPAFFCVHPAGGNVLTFVDLAREMSVECSFYAFQSIGLDGVQAPYASVEAMAHHYVAELKTVQPRGPYLLGGYSFGGFIAFEMARQLTADGEAVALLALIDTWAPFFEQRNIVKEYCVDHVVLGDFANRMCRINNIPGVVDVEALAVRDPKTLVPHLLQKLEQTGAFSRSFLDSIERVLLILQANAEALREYMWPVYNGRISVFRATDVGPASEYVVSHPALGDQKVMTGWTQLSTEPLEMFDVPGTHGTLVSQPYVNTLAAVLTERIRATATQSSRGLVGAASPAVVSA